MVKLVIIDRIHRAAKEIIKFQCRADKCPGIYLLFTLIIRHYGTPNETPVRLCIRIKASIPVYTKYDAAISQKVIVMLY